MTGDHENRITDYTAVVTEKAYSFYPQMKAESITFTEETANTIVNGTNPGFQNGVMQDGYIVRRLTPTECERLQAYPDGWTDIGEWEETKTDKNGKVRKVKRKTSDANRYKALGNSICTAAWRFILEGILDECKEGTMASLFDGICGFPYIWNGIGGKTVWTSEIEPFCIAVTERRFGNE